MVVIDGGVKILALRVQPVETVVRPLSAVAIVLRCGGSGYGELAANYATALFASDQGHEALAVLFVEKRVEHGIDARVGCAQPLGNGRGGHEKALFERAHLHRAAQLDACKDAVEGQPGDDEDDYDHNHHLGHFEFGALHHNLHLQVETLARLAARLATAWNVTAPYLEPNGHVARSDHCEWDQVAETEVGDDEVGDLTRLVRPVLFAEHHFGILGVDWVESKVEYPGKGDDQ